MPTSIDQFLQMLPGEIESASKRIAKVVHQTKLVHSRFYSELTGANVYFKCENLQTTGSFKIRGASNKFLSTSADQRRMIVAASTGNHGKAVAMVAEKYGANCRVFSPKNALPTKLEAIKRYGADVELAGDDCVEAELFAREFSSAHSVPYFSPYNDPVVVAGQGTIGIELCSQLEFVDAVFASVGGGGMLGGLAIPVRERFPDCDFVACSPENSCVMIKSLEAGRQLDIPSTETWSDGTAGGVEADSITFELCQRFITKTALVSEGEMAKEFCRFIDAHGMLIEGAAAVAIAGLIQHCKKLSRPKCSCRFVRRKYRFVDIGRNSQRGNNIWRKTEGISDGRHS